MISRRTDMSHDASVHLPYGYYTRELKGVSLRDMRYGSVRFTPPFFSWGGPVADMLAKMYYAETAGKVTNADPFPSRHAKQRRGNRWNVVK